MDIAIDLTDPARQLPHLVAIQDRAGAPARCSSAPSEILLLLRLRGLAQRFSSMHSIRVLTFLALSISDTLADTRAALSALGQSPTNARASVSHRLSRNGWASLGRLWLFLLQLALLAFLLVVISCVAELRARALSRRKAGRSADSVLTRGGDGTARYSLVRLTTTTVSETMQLAFLLEVPTSRVDELWRREPPPIHSTRPTIKRPLNTAKSPLNETAIALMPTSYRANAAIGHSLRLSGGSLGSPHKKQRVYSLMRFSVQCAHCDPVYRLSITGGYPPLVHALLATPTTTNSI